MRPALRADSPCCRPLVSSLSVLSLRTAARRWGRLRPCGSVPVCSAGCLLSICGTWPARFSLPAGRPVMSCTRSTMSRAAASTGTRRGSAPPPDGIRSRLAAWFGPDDVPLPSRSQRLAEARRQVLADQAARRARDAAERAAAADYPAQAGRAREMLRTPAASVSHACNKGRQASLTKASGTLDASGMTDQRALEILQDYLGPAYFRDFDGDPPLPPELLWGLFTSYCENYLCRRLRRPPETADSRTVPPGSASQPWKGSPPAGC